MNQYGPFQREMEVKNKLLRQVLTENAGFSIQNSQKDTKFFD
jgi:hypothetical protein